MAIDLNKNKGENPNRFNLSKSGESSTAGNDKSNIDQPKKKFDLSKPKDNVAKTSSNDLSSGTVAPKSKSNTRVISALLAIICVAALFWFFTSKENPSNTQDVATVQPDLKEQVTPVSQSTTTSEGAEKLNEVEISPTSNPVSEPAQTTESNPSGTQLRNTPNTEVLANTDIPYKKEVTYKVYQFPFGASDYSQADPELDKLAEVLTKNPDMNISISAYTDDIGEEAYNLALSELRAKSIRDYLVNKGIDAKRMKYQGKGVSTEFATKADNRRAEFILSN